VNSRHGLWQRLELEEEEEKGKHQVQWALLLQDGAGAREVKAGDRGEDQDHEVSCTAHGGMATKRYCVSVHVCVCVLRMDGGCVRLYDRGKEGWCSS